MKTLMKSILAAGGVALAATVAQANPTSDVGVISFGSANITVYSTVTQVGSLYQYAYWLQASPTSTGLDAFSIYAANSLTGSPANILFGVNPANWNGVINGSHVDFDTAPGIGDLPVNNDTFIFTSPLPPVVGTAAGLDDGAYVETSGSVLVPNIPDGGLTISLLGGTLLGLGALRRKIGC
jgi:hypothetical protein